MKAVLVADGLSSPVFVTHAPGDFERLFVVEQTGAIRIVRDGAVQPTPFLDLSLISLDGGERGVLGLAFHPEYADNGYFFVDYTNNAGDTVVARYRVSGDPDVADATSATPVLWIDQPDTNHNGGWIAFGPDGYLYVATGDGGGSYDFYLNAQVIEGSLLGKMLRLDVDRDDFPEDEDRNYGIPPDNPFVGVTGDDEIWSYGFRNPWRCAFDRTTGDLYIADVGQNAYEEIDFQAAGAGAGRNYGWRCMEALSCTGRSGCTCNDPSLTLPVLNYSHGGSPFRCSVTGGEVYRGCAMPDLSGAYFFADFCSAQIWSFRMVGGAATELTERTTELAPVGGPSITGISSFGTDAAGEVYICDLGGELFQIVPDAPPPLLSIVASEPPDGAVDAGQPFEPDGGMPAGWSSLVVTLDDCAEGVRGGDFELEQSGGVDPAPGIEAVTRVGDRAARIELTATIAPVARTTVRSIATGTAVTFAWLPGDVDASGESNLLDLQTLAMNLAGVGPSLPRWSVDVDRSGAATPADLLRVVDLLSGGGVYASYDGATLP